MNYYTSNRIFASALSFSLIAILFSLVVEFGYSIKPCSLCKWQRWGFISIASVSALGILLEQKKWVLGIIFLLFLGLFSVSTYHALIQYGFVSDPCTVPSVSSADDFWKMLKAPLPCSKISFSIFGIPVSLFNSAFSLLFVGYILRASMDISRGRMLKKVKKWDGEE